MSVKFRNRKKNVLKIVLIIVNINKDENKSLISNQFSLKNDFENCTNGNERKKNSKRIPVNRKCVKSFQQVVADKS
jgi:hypothetical protein